MFGQKKDLFELNIVHSLPGRIRLNCKAIEYLNEFNEQILQDIIDLGFVKKVTINNITKIFGIESDEYTNFNPRRFVFIISFLDISNPPPFPDNICSEEKTSLHIFHFFQAGFCVYPPQQSFLHQSK